MEQPNIDLRHNYQAVLDYDPPTILEKAGAISKILRIPMRKTEVLKEMRIRLAEIPNGGFSASGIVWDIDGLTEIQDRKDIKEALNGLEFIQAES